MNTNTKSSAYKNQTKKFLENKFPRISCAAISAVLNEVHFNFTDAFRILELIQSEFPNNGDGRATYPLILLEVKTILLKRDRPKKRFQLRNPQLRNEIDAMRANEINPPVEMEEDPQNQERGEQKEAEENYNMLLECLCCYGDYPPEQMKECSAGSGHKVCTDCIYRYVSEQLDGNSSTVFKCIVNAECSCVYTQTLLDQSLTPKLKSRKDDLIFRENVRNAGMEIWECPECKYWGFPDEQSPTIECPQCKVFYCRRCKEVDHGKMTCEQVRQEKARLENPVLKAQEAMSLAVKRHCPGCGRDFMKADGCNKMKCSVCHTLSCYLCGQQVQDYSHFCNHTKQPCNCGKTCELFTSTGRMEELDRAKRREAGYKVLKESGMREEKILKVLASPPQQKQAAAAAARVLVENRDNNNRPARAQPEEVRPQPRGDLPARAPQDQPRPHQPAGRRPARDDNGGGAILPAEQVRVQPRAGNGLRADAVQEMAQDGAQDQPRPVARRLAMDGNGVGAILPAAQVRVQPRAGNGLRADDIQEMAQEDAQDQPRPQQPVARRLAMDGNGEGAIPAAQVRVQPQPQAHVGIPGPPNQPQAVPVPDMAQEDVVEPQNNRAGRGCVIS